MTNDSADGRTVGAHSEAYSGGAYSRWAFWTQADSDSSCAGSGSVDSQHRCAIAYAAAKLSELQNCASTLSNLVHDNHGDCGSPWIAALGQHACGEPSRSPLGAAMLRLLHDRSQAGEFDRRSRLQQRSAG